MPARDTTRVTTLLTTLRRYTAAVTAAAKLRGTARLDALRTCEDEALDAIFLAVRPTRREDT